MAEGSRKAGMLKRLFWHIVFEVRGVSGCLTSTALRHVEMAIGDSERLHRAELRVAIESAMPLRMVLRRVSPRARALSVFSDLKVWDTAENNGVLIYVGLADRAVEIVADRGIAETLPQSHWDSLCKQMVQQFASKRFEEGLVSAVAALGSDLERLYPASDDVANPNELPNRPIIL